MELTDHDYMDSVWKQNSFSGPLVDSPCGNLTNNDAKTDTSGNAIAYVKTDSHECSRTVLLARAESNDSQNSAFTYMMIIGTGKK